MSRLLALGMGYSALRLARLLAADGWAISGTARTSEHVAAITARGWCGLAFDGVATSPALTAAIGDATHILVSIPPDADGDPVLHCLAGALIASPSLAWIGYLSTVGVYGDHAGARVDESTPCFPVNGRSVRRLAAERQWLAFGASHGIATVVFRLAGIYGPGRSTLDALRSGTAKRIVKPGQVFNRIHVDDIARAVAAAMRTPTAHDLYNLCDDLPAPPQDVVEHAARLIGVPVPPALPFEQASLSPMAASFYAESKRVSNARMKAHLVPDLLYPTYRDGLAAIAASP